MSLMNVNPTRMEMTRLKRQLETARRGHKLLKDKQDEMIRQFMAIIKQTRTLRIDVEKRLTAIYKQYRRAQLKLTPAGVEEALLVPANATQLTVASKLIMNVSVPTIKHKEQGTLDITYGFAFTPPELDQSILDLSKVLPLLVDLAQLEKTCDMLADEIEKTRRRVNAIEFIKIPNLEETIHYIKMKLEDYERNSIIRLMKSKEIILTKSQNEQK